MLTLESHVRTVTKAVSQKIGIMRKCWQIYRDSPLVIKAFYSFILPFFEYCSSVWMSAAPSHLKLLQTAFNSANFLVQTKISLDHRRDVAGSCLFYKILNNPNHPLQSRLPAPADPVRRTRRVARMNSHARVSALSRASTQFNRTFLPHFVEIWNFLPQTVVDASNMTSFKRNVNKYLLTLRP